MTTPESLYRNAIDLNRYSNSVAKRLVVAYDQIILDAVAQLRRIDDATAPVKAARLRAILAQLKSSLDGWAGDSTGTISKELQGLAQLQTEFVEDQLRKALPAGARNAVRTVEVSPQFAQSVVVTDPTQLNVVALSDDLFKAVEGVEGARQVFSLTATQGSAITLPNGEVVNKAFRGLAEKQAQLFGQVVRNGLLTGETTQEIAKRLIGRLEFADFGPLSARQLALAGGQLTTAANHQVMSLVRTSINQVANAASQTVYEANQDITKRYRYVATLDSRTSAICAALDGREFEYGKGPQPPQHFGCRSTTVPVIDYEELGFEPPKEGTRASAVGQVPVNQSYGEWLAKQSHATKAKAIGAGKIPYFNKLAEKYGPRDAIAKLVRDDGSELTLDHLRARYGAIKKG